MYENYPGVFEKGTDVDLMADLLDKERKHVRSWATAQLKSKMSSRAHALSVCVNSSRQGAASIVEDEEETGSDCDRAELELVSPSLRMMW